MADERLCWLPATELTALIRRKKGSPGEVVGAVLGRGERMKRAGAIMIGKTNTPTFGWIGATHNLLFGPTRSPWNLERTPGGSSGGASAAAAAGLGPLHIGTDGGGSIRIPASFAGIFGLKASYGRIPAYPPRCARRRSEEHTSELQSRLHLVCRLLLEK